MTDSTQRGENPLDQAMAMVEEGQRAVVAATRAWAEAMNKVVSGGIPTSAGAPPVDPLAVVEGAFDMVGQVLEMQRQWTRSLLSSISSASGDFVQAGGESDDVWEPSMQTATPTAREPVKSPPGGGTSPPEDLSALSVVQLRARAREAGIRGAATMKKADLIKALSS